MLLLTLRCCWKQGWCALRRWWAGCLPALPSQQQQDALVSLLALLALLLTADLLSCLQLHLLVSGAADPAAQGPANRQQRSGLDAVLLQWTWPECPCKHDVGSRHTHHTVLQLNGHHLWCLLAS